MSTLENIAVRRAWLGQYGALVPVALNGSVTLSSDGGGFGEAVSLEGRRSVWMSSTLRPRTWKISPENLAEWGTNLQLIEQGILGVGPFVWVPPMAQVQNLLAPRAGGFLGDARRAAPVTWGGQLLPARQADGIVVIGRCPVIPGQAVTAAAWSTDPGTITLRWIDVSGAVVSESSAGMPGRQARGRVTAQPPATAVALDMVVSASSGLIVGPTVTWTDKAAPYGAPGGCLGAVIQVGDYTHGRMRGSDTSVEQDFTIMEVG